MHNVAVKSFIKTLHAISNFLVFVYEKSLLKRKNLIQMVGYHLFSKSVNNSQQDNIGLEGPVMKKLVALLRFCVPESPSRFAELSSSLLSETRQFEEHLIEQGFIAKIEDETMQEFYSLFSAPNKYLTK